MYRWTGRPTKEMVERLEEVVRCPDFDEDVAAAVLVGLGEGLSLTKACFVAGVKRGVVRSWCRLMPEFGKMVDVLETDLGGFWRDKAGDEAESGDPALVSARLKIAAAYDKRIARGSDETVGSVVNVQVNW